jgi:hypothetical protein
MDGLRTIKVALWLGLLAFAAVGHSASSEKQGYCKRYSHYVFAGARQHHLKMPRELRWLTVEELMALKQGFPEYKEGDPWPLPFNIVRDDGESDDEKQMITNSYQEGWDLGQAHNSINPDESLKERAFDRCMNGSGT